MKGFLYLPNWALCLACLAVWSLSASAAHQGAELPAVKKVGKQYRLSLNPATPIHFSANPILNVRLIASPNMGEQAVIWQEKSGPGPAKGFYVIRKENGQLSRVRPLSHQIKLIHGNFDPLIGEPNLVDLDTQDSEGKVFIVQFETQPLESYREQIRQLGGKLYQYLPDQAHLVVMEPALKIQVANLPFVRWVGEYRPAYRVEAFILANVDRAEEVFPNTRYNLQIFGSSTAEKRMVADRIRALGGAVNREDAGKHLLEATLTPNLLYQVLNWDEVVFVDRWSPIEEDMDIVRQFGGANFVETEPVPGYTGAGVRGEVLDSGFNVTHQDFQSRPLILHTPVNSTSHGAATSGIVFGDGSANPMGRGMLPDGQGIVAGSNVVFTGVTRYNHAGELLQNPYFAVFQTSSVGSSRTLNYTNISADTDTMLFDWDVLHCQSQSNAEWRHSRPQAWAKNVVSGGGFRHFNTLDEGDDCWGCGNGGASIGPAPDGRIKPDLSHFYDNTFTVTTGSNTSYTSGFGGTSGATPIIAGHFGLFYQMWADGIFGNAIDLGGSVFDNRPHLSTAKAMMINTARARDFKGGTHDFARVHQGWGTPDVKNLYERRDSFYIIDETAPITNLEVHIHSVQVSPGDGVFRATMVYMDPAAVPAAAVQRINDLSLRVTSPEGLSYWGNNGLLDGNQSIPGGISNRIDTVENVWISNPTPGIWSVEVIADEINQDSHVETAGLDADYALVVSGVSGAAPALIFRQRKPFPQTLAPLTEAVLELDILNGAALVEGSSPMLHLRLSPAGDFVTFPLTPGLGSSFTVALPESTCADQPQFYFSAQSGPTTVTYPELAPASLFSITMGEENLLFEDDFEADMGWTIGAPDDNATAGIWIRVNPLAKRDQPQVDHTPDAGVNAFVTGQESDNGSGTENDIDGGKTTLLSPIFDLSGNPDAEISYWRWYSNHSGSNRDDAFTVDISNDGGQNWTNAETVAPLDPDTTGGWVQHRFTVGDFFTPNDQIRIRFVATDQGGTSLVEAALDDFKISSFACSLGCGEAVFNSRLPFWPDTDVLGLQQLICPIMAP